MNKKITFRAGAKTPTRFWNIADIDGDTAEIELYGDVLSEQPRDWWTNEPIDGQYISPEGFAEDLEKIKDKSQITIKLNSLGGDAYVGIAIHNALKALKGRKTVIVEGIAASAASIIAMSGDVIKMFPGSLMMIHGVAGYLMDWYQLGDLKKVYKSFDAIERAMASIYSDKTGLEVTALRSMMEKELWMTGEEAVAKKFADEVVQTGAVAMMEYSAANHLLIVNGVKHNTEGMTIPKNIKIKELAVTAAADVSKKEPENQEGETKIMTTQKAMTLQELRAQYPELVAQIEADAVQADRARIQEIEEIQDTIGDAELVAAAKFTKPTNAAALALAAMKKQKALGENFLKNRQKELEPAAQVAGATAQVEDPADLGKANKAVDKAQEAAAIENAAKLFKQVYNK